MSLDKFISEFKEQFEDSDEVVFSGSTDFKQLEEWSSIMALIIITMVKDKYGVTISADDILGNQTIEDLYKVVVSRDK